MSMLQIHRSALEEVIVPFHKFLLLQSKSKKRLFGFVEGEDDPAYYQCHISSKINSEWELTLIEAGYPKGNRDRVLRLKDIIDWNRYPLKQTAFFVDRDLSDFLINGAPKADNLYVTDNYSIENDIVTSYTLKRTLEELFNVHLIDYEFEIINNLFEEGVEKIANIVEVITCHYLFLKECKINVSFGDIDISKLANIDKCVTKSKTKEEIKEYIAENWPFTFNELRIKQIEEEFSKKNDNYKYIRGKYLIWYFVKFINSFCCYCNEIIPSLDKPITGYRELCEKYAIQDLGPRSKSPCTLNVFVDKTYLAYIKENSQDL